MISRRPRFHSRCCLRLGSPPTKSLTSNISWCCVNLIASLAICVASSRVGLMISAPTFCFAYLLTARIRTVFELFSVSRATCSA